VSAPSKLSWQQQQKRIKGTKQNNFYIRLGSCVAKVELTKDAFTKQKLLFLSKQKAF
jgi:hypothetical protein